MIVDYLHFVFICPAYSIPLCYIQAMVFQPSIHQRWSKVTGHVKAYNGIVTKRAGSRRYAVLVNPKTSVDHMLGTAPPLPPSAEDSENITNMKEFDMKFFNRMIDPNTLRSKLMSEQAHVERIRGLVTGSTRLSTEVPNSSNAFLQQLNNAKECWSAKGEDVKGNFSISSTNIEAYHSVLGILNGELVERYMFIAAKALLQSETHRKNTTSIESLKTMISPKANYQLSIELPYEPQPKSDRSVHLTSELSSDQEINNAKDDGVMLLCYINFSGSGLGKVNLCSGFSVQGGDALADEVGGTGALVVSCLHSVSNETLLILA